MTESRSNDGSLIQFAYTNPDTGVYCLFDVLAGTEIEGYEPPVLPDCCADLGVSVSINFLRPHFFALELMPMISEIANSAGVLLYDSQEDRVYPPGTPSETLIDAWIEHNRRATQAMSQGDNPIRKPFLSSQQSLYWWRYSYGRRALQARLGEDVFVPSIMLMTADQQQITPVVLWSATVERRRFKSRRIPLPQVFPRCEYLMLAWGKAASTLQKGIVPYSAAVSLMENIMEDIEGPVDGMKVLWPARQDQASAVFEGLPLTELGDLKGIASDGFVDVVLP